MPWFRVDDGFMQHEKVLALSRRDRLACVGLWMAAGTWSTRNLKDGKVPFHVLDEIGGTERLAVELVRVGLWRRIKTGYLFVNWKEFQPTRADVEADRAAAKERMRSARERKRAEAEAAKAAGQTTDGSGEHSRTGSGRSSTPSRPVPTRPDPSPSLAGETLGGGSPSVTPATRPPRHCPKHPNGTTDPCGACKDARIAHDEWKPPIPTIKTCTTALNGDKHPTYTARVCPICRADMLAGDRPWDAWLAGQASA